AGMPWCNLFSATDLKIGLIDSRTLTLAQLGPYLDDHMCRRGHRVILHLNEFIDGNPTTDGHWVFVTGRDGSDWRLFDPGWSHATRIDSAIDEPELLSSLKAHLDGFVAGGRRRTFTVSQVRTYKLGALPTAQLCVQAHSPAEVTVIDALGRRLGWNVS